LNDSRPPGIEAWAGEVAEEHGLHDLREIRRTTYDFSDRLRNIVYEIAYDGRPAILKIYDDELINVEADSLQQFHATNKSPRLTAPRLYLHETTSLHRGWLVIEKLPEEGHFMESPLEPAERVRFVEAFIEYRENFPRMPNRPLALAESQDAFQFHNFRLVQSLERASIREQERSFAGEPVLLDRDAFMPRMKGVLDRLRKVFDGHALHWGHGHFKPADVFEFPGEERWALTDFGHTKMLPYGYEPAFAIWWDQMIVAGDGDYETWRGEIGDWSARFMGRLSDLDGGVMDASLLERSLAAILESIVLEQDMSPEERRERLDLQYRLIDELL
jgi:hypothetical protein